MTETEHFEEWEREMDSLETRLAFLSLVARIGATQELGGQA